MPALRRPRPRPPPPATRKKTNKKLPHATVGVVVALSVVARWPGGWTAAGPAWWCDSLCARSRSGRIRNFSDLSSTLSRTVRSHSGDLNALSTGLQSAVASLNRTAASTERMAAQVDTSATSGEIKRIVDDMAQAAGELRRTTAQIRTMAEQLSKSQGRLDSFLANGDSVLVKINAGQGSLGLLLNDP